MPDEITIASTTADIGELNAVLGVVEEPKTDPAAPAKQPTQATEAEAAEKASQQERQDQTGQRRRKPNDPQKRIDQLTGKIYELRETIARLEGKSEGKTQADAATAPAAAKITVTPSRPKPEKDDPKYKSYEEYVEDLADWKAEVKLAEQKAKDAEEERTSRLREKFDNFNAQLREAEARHEDWNEVAEAAKTQKVPAIVGTVLMDFPNAAEMSYYMATHEDFRDKLLAMNDGASDVKIIAELSRLSDYLSDQEEEEESEPEPKPAATKAAAAATTQAVKPVVSAAPAPLKPVGTAATTQAVKKPLDEVSYQEYKRRRKNGEG
jgi:hypothetical protein